MLTRLATEPDALAAVAAEALEIMHFIPPPAGQPWAKGSLVEELDPTGQPICEAGCYKCLLSYYNQPDHTLIDRKDKEAGGQLLDILCRLTRARASANGHAGSGAGTARAAELARTAGSSSSKAWLAYVDANGYRKPDRGQHTIASANTCADFFYDDYNLAVFIDGPHHDGDAQRAADAVIDRKLDEQGYVVVRFPKDTGSWPDIFDNNADLFGAGTKNGNNHEQHRPRSSTPAASLPPVAANGSSCPNPTLTPCTCALWAAANETKR